jgi:hypothetical protein
MDGVTEHILRLLRELTGSIPLFQPTQLLDIGAGDEEEHAVMLYNMLYHLSLKENGKS